MLGLKAFHLIALIAWFAGLFYLPRLFVYHAETQDDLGLARFIVMERRLYYGIMWPAGIATTLFGLGLIAVYPAYYLTTGWMHAKLGLVALLWFYHVGCGHYLACFARNANTKTALFFRFYNEIPTLLLIAIVVLVVVKPF
jgi:putative membrane protein